MPNMPEKYAIFTMPTWFVSILWLTLFGSTKGSLGLVAFLSGTITTIF